MKIAEHIMGMPGYTVDGAIELFYRIGTDGAEIVAQGGYYSGIPYDCGEKSFPIVKRCAEENEAEISCLTPYNSYPNSPDKEVRQAEIEGVRNVIDYCQYLNVHYTRIYGGNLLAGDTQKLEERREKPVESLWYPGNLAARKGVVLIVENYFDTMVVFAKDSAVLIWDINHPVVHIPYGQANLTSMENERYEEVISLQQQYASYVHVEGLVFLEGKDFVSSDVPHLGELKRSVRTHIVGEGILDWPAILKPMKVHGYDGWLSLKYEGRWHLDDTPDVSIGIKKSTDYLKSIFS